MKKIILQEYVNAFFSTFWNVNKINRTELNDWKKEGRLSPSPLLTPPPTTKYV